MQILLSCAKIMEKQTVVTTPTVSNPQSQREAEHFALLMSQRSVEELMDMFRCSRRSLASARHDSSLSDGRQGGTGRQDIYYYFCTHV